MSNINDSSLSPIKNEVSNINSRANAFLGRARVLESKLKKLQEGQENGSSKPKRTQQSSRNNQPTAAQDTTTQQAGTVEKVLPFALIATILILVFSLR